MRRGLRAAAAATATMLWLAGPALAQAADDDDADAPAATAPAKPGTPPKAPRASAPKPAAPVRSETTPATTPSGKVAVAPQDVRPPANILVDCAKAPAEAVTKLSDDLAQWATVYCTKLGHIFNANDRHFGAFRDSGLRASFSAADLAGKTGEPGNDAYFSKISFRQLPPAERDALIAADPSVKRILVGKSLWRLDLTAVGGKGVSFIAIDPSAEIFWVFPMDEKGSIGTPAFYVTSLEALNKAR